MNESLAEFIRQHRLPSWYTEEVDNWYRPLAGTIADWTGGGERLVGISGAQGSGKSTVAALLRYLLAEHHGLNTVIVSLDDFYLTWAERESKAAEQHPLFATRGVPGTHALDLLHGTLDQLLNDAAVTVQWPAFDKATDDRRQTDGWHRHRGAAELVLLEGWCVGVAAADESALVEPINILEAEQDPDGCWRRAVNRSLGDDYEPLWRRLDRLVWLRVPGFDAVRRWRREQEDKLRECNAAGPAVMDDQGIERFLQYYERLTRHGLESLGKRADICLQLGNDHRVKDQIESGMKII